MVDNRVSCYFTVLGYAPELRFLPRAVLQGVFFYMGNLVLKAKSRTFSGG